MRRTPFLKNNHSHIRTVYLLDYFNFCLYIFLQFPNFVRITIGVDMSRVVEALANALETIKK